MCKEAFYEPSMNNSCHMIFNIPYISVILNIQYAMLLGPEYLEYISNML